MKTFPTLFKKSHAGEVWQWTISVDRNIMTTNWGRVGKTVRKTREVIKAGKNTGRANATTSDQQAIAEAQARWEKNLLLEKIRMKDTEEKKNREKIQELEARLKGETGKSDISARELEQVRHLVELKEKVDTIKQIEEIKREELSLKEELPAPAKEAALPPAIEIEEQLSEESSSQAAHAALEKPEAEVEVKSFKSMKRSSEIKLETSLGRDQKETEDEAGLTSRKFKSLGQTQEPAYVYGSHYDKPLPGPEAAPPGAFKPEAHEPLPQQAGGVVYDFTVVTSKPPETSQQFQIETRYEVPVQQAQPAPAQQQPQPQAVKPQAYDFGVRPQQAPAPAPAPQPQQAPAQQGSPAQHGFQFQFQQQASSAPAHMRAADVQSASPSAQPPACAPEKTPAEAAAESPEKTQRIPVPAVKGKAEVKAPEKKPKRGGKMAFIAILIIFGSIAAGGLGYFFLGEGVSFSEFSMLSLGGKKKATGMTSQLEAKGAAEAPVVTAEPAGVDAGTQPQAQQAASQQTQAQTQPPAQPQVQPQAAQPEPKSANENIRKSLEIVKGYKLSGGRGTIKSWFSNSFLSGAVGGTNEEWTATPLHGDILVVQYRLFRPRQEPMVYQFEVDAAKQDIVRGINNNAIELLDFSSGEKSVSAAPVKMPAAKAKPRKRAKKAGEIPILPLPDAPSANPSADQEPTGFENGQAEGSEQVKYLKAQESDEELF